MPHRLGLPHETRMTPEPEESYLDKLRLGRRRRQWETEPVGPSWRAMGRGFFSEEQRHSLLENERISRGLPVAYDIRIGASMEEINDALEEYLARTPDPESRIMEALGEAAQPAKETLDIVRGQTLLAIQNWIPGEQTAERIAREYEESGKGGRFGFLEGGRLGYEKQELPWGVKGAFDIATDPTSYLGVGAGKVGVQKVGESALRHYITRTMKSEAVRPSIIIPKVKPYFVKKAIFEDLDDVMQAVVVPTTPLPKRNIFRLKPINPGPGLTRSELWMNLVRGTVGRPFGMVKDNALAAPAMRYRAQVLEGSQSKAQAFSNSHSVALNKAFEFNNMGQILDRAIRLAADAKDGIPTIQDLAANLPKYAKHLSENQTKALNNLRADLKPYYDDLIDMGLDPGKRADIKPGGFYIPRGNAVEEGVEMPFAKVKGKFFRPSKKGYEKLEEFSSMAEGIKEGWEYSPIRNVLLGYSEDVGARLIDKHVANYFLALTDATGMKIGLSPLGRLTIAERNLLKHFRDLDTKLSRRSKTVIAQTARLTAVTAEAARAERAVAAGLARRATATMEAELAASRYSVKDLNEARTYFDQSISQTRDVAVDILRSHQALVRRRVPLSAAEEKSAKSAKRHLESIKKTEDLENKLAQRLGEGKTRNKTIRNRIAQQRATTEKFEKWAQDQHKNYESLASKYDDMLERDMGLRGMRADVRAELIEARQTERALVRAGMRFASINRKMNVLAQEHTRQQKIFRDAAGRMTNIRQNLENTSSAIEALKAERNELAEAYYKAVAKKKGPVEGMGSIDLMGLNNHMFPVEMADAVNNVLKSEKGALEKYYLPVKNMTQAAQSTYDMSATSIQGLLGAGDNPKGFGTALWVSIRAWEVGGDKMLGKFLIQHDTEAAARGLLTSQEWATHLLRIGGQDIGEFSLGPGFAPIVEKVPMVKQANRAFGFFGDALRLEWANSMLADELAYTGRSVADLVSSGDVARIAEAANNMTGYSSKRAFGSAGDMLLFAPRFLQARINTVVKAGMGVAREPLPGIRLLGGGATLDQRVAQRSVLKTVGTAVILTEGLNRMQGRETDWNLFITDSEGKKQLNSNFMAVRGFGRDWKLLGTWDSIARALMLVGMSARYNDPTYITSAYRNMSAPPISLAFDLLTGSSGIGERTRDTPLQIAHTISKRTLPFVTDEIPDIAAKVREGQLVPAGATLLGEIIGAKSAPMGYRDVVLEVAEELRSADPDFGTFEIDPDTRRPILDRSQSRKVNDDSRVVEKLAKIEERREPLTNRQTTAVLFDNMQSTRSAQEQNFKTLIQGTGDRKPLGGALKDAISTFKHDRFVTSQGVMRDPQMIEAMGVKETKLLRDAFAEQYWTAVGTDSEGRPLIDPVTLIFDFDARDEARDDVLAEARESGMTVKDEQFITGEGIPPEESWRGIRFDDPEVRMIIEEYESDMAVIRPYYEIMAQELEKYGLEDDWREYLQQSEKSLFLNRPENSTLKALIRNIVPALRLIEREANAELDILLWKWGLITNAVNSDAVYAIYDLRQRQGGEITDMMAITSRSPLAPGETP